MLAWEYPPQVVGGLGRHVADLSEALVGLGHEVHVLTGDAPGASSRETLNGVNVHRLKMYGPAGRDFVESVTHLNVNMLEAVLGLVRQGYTFDIVHGHDWLAAYAGKALKHGLMRPLVATIHATEFGRNHGLHNDLQRHISNLEWWLTYEAWNVICCSEYMRGEIRYIFQVPVDKVRIIPNGVKASDFAIEDAFDKKAFRRRYAADNEQIIYYVGRLVHEKGVDTLIETVPRVLARHNQAKFVIAGKGPAEFALRERAHRLGVSQSVYFAGFVDDLTRNRLYACADVAVVPSLYEPFGIVALEAMAAGVPVVVSDTGGLSEVVRHAQNGLRAYPGNAQSLADNILAYLDAPEFAQFIKRQAAREVREIYDWSLIAQKTLEVYGEVLSEFEAGPWAEIGSFPADGILSQTRLTAQGTEARYQDTGSAYGLRDSWERSRQLAGSRYLGRESAEASGKAGYKSPDLGEQLGDLREGSRS
ncbi:MAG: glycosyltransferase family 4 protein [Firmicutes bacterium]|nr:glycosyltransferase family 4 protein [Bacillota bacterium]